MEAAAAYDVLQSAMQYGEVQTTEDLSGVMFLAPPGRTRWTGICQIRVYRSTADCRIRTLPIRQHLRGISADTQERLLQGRPNYYLWGLVVDSKAAQRRGSALLKRLFEQADRETYAGLSRDDQFANVAYYEQRVPADLPYGKDAGDDLPFWCMLREPGGIKRNAEAAKKRALPD
ncbi:MAG: hypothetical protein R2912_03170 [Eubacteriales bacterium]